MASTAAFAPPLPPLPADFAGGIDAWPTTPPPGTPSGRALASATEALLERMTELQGALLGEGRRALLVVLQARDAGGKDGTIRRVVGAFSPQGVRVTSFRAPVGEELARDFLWRVHREVPARGMVGVFNRSHYEDVLAARVRGLVEPSVWRARYAHIAAFERLLTDTGTAIVKIFLHVSRDEQARRLRARLEDPGKNWKFDPGDIDDRARWDDYSAAYDDAFRHCNAPGAPWYVVPADDKRARDYLVAGILRDALERMAPAYPPADPRLLALLGSIV
jgi:PPK2 family polyphosphate:nucleotide phosphotransferase